MDFMGAVKAMKEGKRVRRGAFNWKDIESIRMLPTTIIIYNKTGEKVYLNGDDYEATDWQIVEEKPEDWTDLKTILDWRTRTQERINQYKRPVFVKINETLKVAFFNNLDEVTKQRLSRVLAETKICEIEGIKVTVEEKKTLSDKINYRLSGAQIRLKDKDKCQQGVSYNLDLEDVKEAIKEFIDWINNPKREINLDNTCKGRTPNEIKAKEIFGERLI